jgi:hypothetical protein
MPPPTDEQWAQLAQEFPSLVRANVTITGDPTGTYNCIAFSLGVLDRWINPPDPLAAFQALYNGAPYNHPTVATGAAGAQIDGWALPAIGPGITETTHGSRRYAADPALWESKLGPWYRITHGRDELRGVDYGRIVTSFT